MAVFPWNIVLVLVFTALAYGGSAWLTLQSRAWISKRYRKRCPHMPDPLQRSFDRAGPTGTALFVGIMSGQMEHLTAAGATRAAAYASGGFPEITLGIIIDIIAVGFVLSFWYSRIVRKKKH